jgi:hypothetical protein
MCEELGVDWNLFENIFNISRDDIVEVKNIYLMKCKVYLLVEDVKKLFNNELDVNMWYMHYVYKDKKWIGSKINYDTFKEMNDNAYLL